MISYFLDNQWQEKCINCGNFVSFYGHPVADKMER